MREEMPHKMNKEAFAYAPHYGMMHPHLNMAAMNPQFYPHHNGMKDDQGGRDNGGGNDIMVVVEMVVPQHQVMLV